METQQFNGWKFLQALGKGLLFLAAYVVISTLLIQLYSFLYFGIGAVVYLMRNPGTEHLDREIWKSLVSSMQGSVGPVSIVLGAGFTILAIWLFYAVRKKSFARACGFRKTAPELLVLAFAAGIFLNMFTVTLMDVCSRVIPDSWTEQNAESVGAVMSGSLLIVFLAVYIAAPFVEEILFRGLFYTGIRDTSHVIVAVILSSLMFGVFHGNPLQGIYTFVVALFLAYVRQVADSLWPAILLHMGYNSSSLFLSELYDWLPVMVLLIGSIAITALLLTGYGLRVRSLRKLERFAQAEGKGMIVNQ